MTGQTAQWLTLLSREPKSYITLVADDAILCPVNILGYRQRIRPHYNGSRTNGQANTPATVIHETGCLEKRISRSTNLLKMEYQGLCIRDTILRHGIIGAYFLDIVQYLYINVATLRSIEVCV